MWLANWWFTMRDLGWWSEQTVQEGRLFLFLSQGFLMVSSLPLHTCWNSHSLKRLKKLILFYPQSPTLGFKEVPSYVANGICSLALHPLNCQVTCWITLFTLNVLHYNLLFLKKFFYSYDLLIRKFICLSASGSDIVKLYDLTTLCEETEDKYQNPFTMPVAILLYKYECYLNTG